MKAIIEKQIELSSIFGLIGGLLMNRIEINRMVVDKEINSYCNQA